MYTPRAYREEDQTTLVDFMRTHSFATLTVAQNGHLMAVHIPLVVRMDGEEVILFGHVAKANPIWQAFDSSEALVIFGGPHAYISTEHYDKLQSVPTWNYVAVHAYGVPKSVGLDGDADSMRHMLEELIDVTDASYSEQWESLPDDFRNGLMQGIVGFEMMVTRLEGQRKLSQNKTPVEQHRIADALAQMNDQAAVETGMEMMQNLDEANRT